MPHKLEEARAVINEVDARMAELFVRRMQAAETVYEYKKENGLPIRDPKREEAVIAKNAALVEDPALREYYVDFIGHTMSLSRAYQHRLRSEDCPARLHMELGENSYDITVERGILGKAREHLDLNRRVLIVTDTGVPAAYAETLAKQCRESVIFTLEAGEASKSLEQFGRLLQTMLDHGFSRKDCVAAVGGGVVGDLAGFAASAYMRGIDFYNIPTTLLAQIDSSIGGKTAVNFGGVKNTVGAFYQPKGVLIDPDLLKTLPPRQIAGGLAEAVKMALTSDAELFTLFEEGDIERSLEEIIIRSLRIKQSVVEQDEKETGLRRILNFGHTVGHGIESCTDLYHGECVALGMLPMCGDALRPRLVRVLKKCGLYRELKYDWDKIGQAAFHDKKADGGSVTVTLVMEPGSFEIKTVKCSELIGLAKTCLEGRQL